MTSIDIYVRETPQNLRETPQVYEPYAVRQSQIFIGDDLRTLLANPQFVQARDDAFDGWTPEVMDIRVTADGIVLVRGNPGEEWRNTHFRTDNLQAQAIARKTQMAWQRLQELRENSREPSPRPLRSPSPLRGREVVYEREAPRELTERLHKLERENHDLRSRLDRMELQRQLDTLGRQLTGVEARLDRENETTRGLAEQIASLRSEIQKGQAATIDHLKTNNEDLQGGKNGSLTQDIETARVATDEANRARDDLAAQLEKTKEALGQLRDENEDNRAACEQVEGDLTRINQAIQTRDHRPGETSIDATNRFVDTIEGQLTTLGEQVGELAPLREKARAYDAAERQQQAALAPLSQTIDVGIDSIDALPGDVYMVLAAAKTSEASPPTDQFEQAQAEFETDRAATEKITQAREALTENPQRVDDELEQLKPENEDNRAAREQAEGELSRINQAIQKGDHSGENPIDAINQFVDTIKKQSATLGEQTEELDLLRETAEAYEEAQRKQQAALATLSKTLGVNIDSIDTLPGAVSTALAAAKARETQLARQSAATKGELTEQLGIAQRKVKRLEAAAQQVAAKHAETVEELESKAKRTEARVKEAKANARELSLELCDKTSALEAEKSKTSGQARELAAFRDQVSFLETQAIEAGEREAQLRETMRGLQGTVADNEGESHSQKRILDRLQGELTAAQEENRTVTQALEEAREALRKATREHKASTREQASTIDTLTRQVEALKRKVAQAESNEEEQTRTLQAAKEAKREAEKQHRVLTAQLEDLRGENEVLKRKVGRKDQTIERQKAELTKAREECSEAVMRQSEMRGTHQSEENRLETRVEELTDALREAKQARDGSSNRNGELQRELTEMRQELQEAKGLLEAKEQAQARLIEQLARSNEEKRRLSELLGTIESYERTCAYLRTAPRSLEEELGAAQFNGPKYTLLPGDIKSLIEDLKVQIKALKMEQQAVRSKETVILDLQSDLACERANGEQATKRIAGLEAKLEEQEKEFERLKQTHQENRSKQSTTLSSLRSKLASVREETATTLSEKNQETRALQEENRKLTHTIGQQHTTIRRLEEELAAFRTSYDALESDHEGLKDKFAALKAQHKELIRTHEELGEEREHYQEGATLFEQEYNKQRQEALELQRQLSELRPAFEALEKKDQALAEENQHLYTLFGEVHQQLQEAAGLLEADQQVQAGCSEELEALRKEQERLMGILDAIDQIERENQSFQEPKSLAEEFAELTPSGPANEKLPDNIRSLIESLKEQLLMLQGEQKKIEELEFTVAELNAQLDKAEQETGIESRTVAELRSALAAQEEDVTASRDTFKEKQDLIESLMFKLSKAREEAEQAKARNVEMITAQEKKERELEKKLRIQTAANDKLQIEFDELSSNHYDLFEENGAFSSRIKDLEQQLRALRENLVQLQKEKESAEEDRGLLHGAFGEQQAKAQRLESEIYDMRQALEGIQGVNDRLREEKVALYRVFSTHVAKGVNTPEDAEYALQMMKNQQVRDFDEKQPSIEQLLEEVQKTDAAKREMEASRDAALLRVRTNI